jgi:hypothetical protein
MDSEFFKYLSFYFYNWFACLLSQNHGELP